MEEVSPETPFAPSSSTPAPASWIRRATRPANRHVPAGTEPRGDRPRRTVFEGGSRLSGTFVSQPRDDVTRRGEVLDDAAEGFVDRDVGGAGAAGEGAGEDLADLAEQMILADRSGRQSVEIFGALGADALLMVGEQAGSGDEGVFELARARPRGADRVDMGAVGDPFRAEDRLGRGGHRADDVGAGHRFLGGFAGD